MDSKVGMGTPPLQIKNKAIFCATEAINRKSAIGLFQLNFIPFQAQHRVQLDSWTGALLSTASKSLFAHLLPAARRPFPSLGSVLNPAAVTGTE